MIIFMIIFITVYGLIHLYTYYRIRSLGVPARFLSLLLILLTFSPLFLKLIEPSPFNSVTDIAAWLVYIWMGVVFLYVSVQSIIDTIFYFVSKMYLKLLFNNYASITCKISVIITFLISCYSFYEARNIRTNHVNITSNHLKPGTKPFRIVQISDVHLGLLCKESRLSGMVKVIKDQSPDILVSTGDLIDGRMTVDSHVYQRDIIADMISNIPTPLGKYAVSGNHEYYAGIEESMSFTQKCGFKVLRNEILTLPNGMTIVGMDDIGKRKNASTDKNSIEMGLIKSAPDNFKVLLKHRPVLIAENDGLINLQLSGHTHRGQLIPFYPFTWLEFSLRSGTTVTGKGSTVHVSNGTGTWGPPMRFLAPPEITVIDVKPM